jgi:hypothetical protein
VSAFASQVKKHVERLRRSGLGDGGACSLEHPPLTGEQLEEAEARLGFAVPPSLRSLYESVGNGGFGPSYGLLGLIGGAKQEDGCDAIEMLEAYQQRDNDDPLWAWPDMLIPVVHLGCAMFFCVDASTSDGMVIWFEPNPHEAGQPWTDSFLPLNLTFEDLMTRWTEGDDVGRIMESTLNLVTSASE